MKKQGFMLIIVLGLLGTLSLIAIQLTSTSSTMAKLQETDTRMVEARLLARSGIEIGIKKLNQHLNTDLAAPVSTSLNHLNITMPVGFVSVDFAESSGAIDINDGIAAGNLELSGAYSASAIDPRPETPSGSGLYVQDVSGLINLRLRRILNSYGDTHKFAAEHDWPVWKFSDFTGATPYGDPFIHSSTAVGNRNISLPGRDLMGLPLSSANVAAQSTGLGDRIIANRPAGGFTATKEIREILNTWAIDLALDPTHWQDEDFLSFFDMVTADLTVTSIVDRNFYRIAREFGPDADGDGFVDYNNLLQDPHVATLAMDTNPPDLTNLWIRHPVSIININACSIYTRAALFYAPTNVALACESVHIHKNRPTGKALGFNDQIPALGVGGPSFHISRHVDNGNATSRQQGKLMSLRDAMVLSQAYQSFPVDVPGQRWIDSFGEFTQFLRSVTDDSQTFAIADNESAHSSTLFLRNGRWATKTNGNKFNQGNPPSPYFTENYVHQILPHLLSPIRRLPGWLHAPVSLLSPIAQHGSRGGKEDRVHRTAEDFVVRCTLPKVSFLPDGIYDLQSKGTSVHGSIRSHAQITTTLKLFEIKTIRSQTAFVQAKDPSTDADILLGPEPYIPSISTSTPPHMSLGSIGLRDRIEDTSSLGNLWTHMARMTFDRDDPLRVDSFSGTQFGPQNPAADTFLAPNQLALQNSELEGFDRSIFSAGSQGSDLSPFGGISLSSRGHGSRSTDQFADTLYWRPYGPGGILTPADTAGSIFGKGMMSMWVRIPSGYMCERTIPLVQLTLWERVEVSNYNYMAPPGHWMSPIEPPVLNPPIVNVEVRPVTITLGLEIGEPYQLGPPNFFEWGVTPTRFILDHSRGRELKTGFPTFW